MWMCCTIVVGRLGLVESSAIERYMSVSQLMLLEKLGETETVLQKAAVAFVQERAGSRGKGVRMRWVV